MKWVENGKADGVAFVCSDDKPNIFLIGDSLRRGYCATVKECLENEANVFYVNDNSRSTQYVIFNIKYWADMFDDCGKVDVVHFNCGQWDAAHWSRHELSLTSESEYAKNIKMIIDLLRGFFPKAKIVFATTTPMNPENESMSSINPRSNEEINTYNRIAVKVAEEEGVAINDLHSFMEDWGSECFIDTCHLTPDSFKRLGEEVARWLSDFVS